VGASGRTDAVATIADPSTECAGQLLGVHESGTGGRRARLRLPRIHQHRTLVVHALRLLWLLLLRLMLLL